MAMICAMCSVACGSTSCGTTPSFSMSFAIGRGVLRGDLADRHAEFLRRVVDLVVDVGDVAGIDQARETPAQQAREHVEDHRPAGVAHVHVVVDRGPAQVHGHARGIERREGFQAAVQVVVEADFHAAILASTTPPTLPLSCGFRREVLEWRIGAFRDGLATLAPRPAALLATAPWPRRRRCSRRRT
jgi:hypothetical protein